MTVPARTLPHVSARLKKVLQRGFAVLQACNTQLTARAALQLYLRPSRREVDAIDRDCLARACVQWMPLGTGQLRVLTWGTGPRTVVLLHGWGSHAPRWSNMVEQLLAQGWRVIAFDAPGHGKSSGRSSSLPQFEAALGAVLATHAPVHALIAHSLGALAAAAVLSRTPPVTLRAAVLVSLPHDIAYLMESYEQMLQLRAPARERLVQLFVQRFGVRPEEVTARSLLPGIACPVLLVHDREDDVVPLEQAQQLAPLLQHGSLHITQGLGHSELLRDPAMIGAAVGFIGAALRD